MSFSSFDLSWLCYLTLSILFIRYFVILPRIIKKIIGQPGFHFASLYEPGLIYMEPLQIKSVREITGCGLSILISNEGVCLRVCVGVLMSPEQTNGSISMRLCCCFLCDYWITMSRQGRGSVGALWRNPLCAPSLLGYFCSDRNEEEIRSKQWYKNENKISWLQRFKE